MRVVQLCEGFSRSSETFIYDTVTELDRQGVDCHVLTMNRANEEERPYEKVHLAPWPGRWNVPRLWRRTLATLGIAGDVDTHNWPGLRARFRRHLDRLDPDVVHAQFGPMGVLAAPVTRTLDIPLVVSFMGRDISVLPKKQKVKEQYRRLFSVASFVIGISNHICRKLRRLGSPSEKTILWHLGTKTEEFKFTSPNKKYDGGAVHLLHVGRLVEKKAPLELVKAFLLAREEVNDEVVLRLTIAGDGPLRDPVNEYLRGIDEADQVDCLGEVPHEEVRRLMGQSHLYTQHCKTASDGDEEGQGVTFVEAQASGLPIVTTNHNGIPDVVVDGETGYLVPEGDTEAMADRIAHLAKHPEKWERMGQAGRKHVEENFNLTTQVKKLISIYRQL